MASYTSVPSHRCRSRRQLVLESLESRWLMASQVIGRYVFYNDSAFDRANSAITADDDQAIAPDKQALLPGQTANFTNYTNYSRGINGVMIDVRDLADPAALGEDDFLFRSGNVSDVREWTSARDPFEISVRSGMGAQGTDRIVMTWNNNVIQNSWLQITLLANATTGLTNDDTFYFGNAIGESGNSEADAIVDHADEWGAVQNPRSFFRPAPIDFPYDYNRDARVNATDQVIVRNRATRVDPDLILFNAPQITEAPEALSASDGQFVDRIELTWNEVAGAQGYEIWRGGTDSLRDAMLIATQSATTYSDTSAFIEVPYRYWVRAHVPGRHSLFSTLDVGHRDTPEVTDIPFGTAQAIYNIATGDIFVVVNDVANWYIESTLGRLTGTPLPDPPGNGLATDNNRRVGDTQLAYFSYSFHLGPVAAAGLPDGDLRIYWNAYGPLRIASVETVGMLRQLPPTVVDASDSDRQYIRVSWSRAFAAIGYEVWRSETNDFNTAQRIAETAYTEYFDTSAATERTYYYWIRSTGAFERSAPSRSSAGWRSPFFHPTFAAAYYIVETGEIRVTVREVTDWFIESNRGGLTGDPVGDLPGLGLVTDTDRKVGETARRHSYLSYRNHSLGAVAAPYLPPHDLVMHFKLVGQQPSTTRVEYVSLQADFTPLAAPIDVIASDHSADPQIEIRWSPVPGALGYTVWRNSRNQLDAEISIAGHTTSTSFLDTVPIDQTFYYWVSAQNHQVTSGLSASDSGIIPLPAGPANVQATDDVFNSQIHVTWEPIPNAIGYEIWSSRSSDLGAARLLSAANSERSHIDQLRGEGRFRYYWIRGIMANGFTQFSSPDVGSIRIDSLLAPTSVRASDNLFADNIVVTWTPVVNADTYTIYRNTVNQTDTAEIVAAEIVRPIYSDIVPPNSQFYYWVRAKSGNTVSDFSLPNRGAVADDIAVGRQVMAEYSVTTGEIEIAVDSVVDWYVESQSAAFTGENISYPLPGGGVVTDNDLRIGESSASNISYATLLGSVARLGLPEDDLSVWYRDELDSPLRRGLLMFVDYRLGTPEWILATDGTEDGRVEIHWAPVNGAQSYQVWRGESLNPATAIPLAAGLLDHQFEDTEALRGHTYYYWIRVESAAGLSGLSRPETGFVKSILPPGEVTASNGVHVEYVEINWRAVDGAESYQVWRSDSSFDRATASLLVDGLTELQYRDYSAVYERNHYYWVRAFGQGELSPFGNYDSGGLLILLAPTVSASDGDFLDRVRIQWQAVPGAHSYEVWRSTQGNPTPLERVAVGLTENSFDDLSAVQGARYEYYVRGIGAHGTGYFGIDTGFIRIVTDQAVAIYNVVTGEITVTIQDVVNWYIESQSASLGRAPIQSLPAGGGLVTAHNRRIGESSFTNFSYADLYLGPVAAPGLSPIDLRLFYNDELGIPIADGRIVFVGSP